MTPVRPPRRVRPVALLVALALTLVTAAACEPAQLNRWLIDHGRPPLQEPELSRAAAAIAAWQAEQHHAAAFEARVEAVTVQRLGLSWRPGCPIDPADLRLLTLSYWGDDARPNTGELIVHRSVSLHVVRAFRELWAARFPIHQMQTAEKFVGPEDFAPDGTFIDRNEPDFDNNTSAFFCRSATGRTAWSEHTFGTAIDINPLVNPYIKGSVVVPPNGVYFADIPGTITRDSIAVTAMRRAGLRWGGDWVTSKDFMHFSVSGR